MKLLSTSNPLLLHTPLLLYEPLTPLLFHKHKLLIFKQNIITSSQINIAIQKNNNYHIHYIIIKKLKNDFISKIYYLNKFFVEVFVNPLKH